MAETITSRCWLTASEAAEHLRVKPRTILRWSKLGLIPAHRLSGCARTTWRYLASELDAAILASPTEMESN